MTNATILVATWDAGLFAVTGNGRTQEIANQPVRGLAPDGHGGALAIVGQHELQRRSPAGEWSTIAASDCELSCCLAVGDSLYVGTDEARLLQWNRPDGALHPVEGFDRTPGRDTWFAGSAIVNGQRLGPSLGIRSLAANSTGRVLFANVHVGGIPRSTDGGTTWQPTINFLFDVHEVCAHPSDPDLVIAASAVGLCISRDAGATWTVEREGLHALHCSAVAFAGDDILVSASTDPFTTQGRTYRLPAEPGGSIQPVEGGMPLWTAGVVDTGCIAVNGSLVAVADRAGNLYVSDNFGRSWHQSITGLPTPNCIPSCVLIC